MFNVFRAKVKKWNKDECGELEQESLMNVVSQLGGVKGESIAHTVAHTINQNRRRGKIENTENGEGGLRKMNAFHLNKQVFFPFSSMLATS